MGTSREIILVFWLELRHKCAIFLLEVPVPVLDSPLRNFFAKKVIYLTGKHAHDRLLHSRAPPF